MSEPGKRNGIWDKPYSLSSLRTAMYHRAVDRNRDRWLVLCNGHVVEGHPELHRAAGACQILNDHAEARDEPREYSFCILERGLCQEVDQGLWREKDPPPKS